ncbi:MAG: TATA-box-binding protein [Promethearchaeota archaeon]
MLARFRIQNIVVNIDLGVEIDLELLSDSYRDVELNTDKFPRIRLPMSNPKATILLFSNGKMIVTGLKKTNHANIVLEKVKRKLDRIGVKIDRTPDLEVVNVVASADMGRQINLDLASITLERSIYEPEVFPGMIYRLEVPIKCVLLVFSSGKVVITGLKREADVKTVIKHVGGEFRDNNLFNNFDDESSI